MLKLDEIRELIQLIDESGITDFTYEIEEAKISIRKKNNGPVQLVDQSTAGRVQSDLTPVESTAGQSGQAVQTTPENAAEQNGNKSQPENGSQHYYTIESPMVGTFYASPSPEAGAYVQVGDQLTESTVVCIVEAMKLMNEIQAEVKGELVEILVENGQLVEYGQPLFLVKQA